MSRQIIPIAGAVVGAVAGFYLGGPSGAVTGAQYGYVAGAVAAPYIDPVLLQGNKIGDSQTQVAAEGGARAIVFGKACITATCVIARGNRVITKKKQSNGKGTTSRTQNETVSWTFAIGLGEAIPGGTVTRVWQDENLVFDLTEGHSISNEDNSKFHQKFRFHDGSETQLPDPDLQVFLGDETPYFRGTAYVVFPNFDLTQTAERIPTFRFEVIGALSFLTQIESIDFRTHGDDGQTEAVTLNGDPGTVYNLTLQFTGRVQARAYSDNITRVGGNGRFVTATSQAATPERGDDMFQLVISDPPQTYYLNAYLPGEDTSTFPIIVMDGSAQWSLPIRVRGNATVTMNTVTFGTSGGGTTEFATNTTHFAGFYEGGAPIGLDQIVSALMQRVGMSPTQFDVTALHDHSVAGVCIQSTGTAADAVQSCVSPFMVDPTEVDGVVTFVKRGAPVLRTLTIADLTEEPDVAARENVIEYPAKVHFFYQSPITGYASTKATSYRSSPQVDSSGEGSVVSPITFADSVEPANIASTLHKVMWNEAGGSFSWKVGQHCIDLVPGDVVGLFLRGQVTRARIIGVENDGLTIVLTLIKDRQSAYTSNVTAIPLPFPTPPDPTTMSKSVLAVLDIPALQDTDDALLYYTAVSGETATWSGAQVQRSLDGGSTWTVIDDVTSDVTMGRLTVAMTAASSSVTDTTNTVTVQLFDAANELLSFSDTELLQEQGGIALQLADGTWEILQYRDAVDNGAGLWTLSYLQRGRLDTTSGAHAVGALFVLLGDDLSKHAGQVAWLGGDLKHRAISYSTSAEDADIVTTTYVGNSQREWSPASAVAEFDGTFLYVHDIVARHRFGTEVSPIASVNYQGFRVTYSDGTTTMTADIPAGDSAHISTAPLVAVTSVSVAELNRFTGPGAGLPVTVTTVAAGSLTPVAIVDGGGA
jgi:hypothetical protein